MTKILNMLKFLKLARDVQQADPDAEKKGLQRGVKGLIAGLIGGAGAVAAKVLTGFVATQSGPGCVLGPTACAILANPMVANAIAASVAGTIVGAIMGGEKYLNEKFGLGIQVLDTVDRGENPAPPAPPAEPPSPLAQ